MDDVSGNAPPTRRKFWELPVETLDRAEWEALCDGCGRCCMHKLEDDDTGEVYHTNVSCRLLDTQTACCTDYRNRRALVPDCLRLTPKLARTLPWLPDTCAYKLRAEGEPLKDWHYLISGDRETVHSAGISVRGKAVSETLAGPIEEHVIEDWETMRTGSAGEDDEPDGGN